ncbi:hypothetical protein UFOVP180_48 [uncultured Caudovirales phage]|uniref:Uncharacterized protein n=1 Tax=uncultured Caudovirales phage TaxID=2100421 RepID=A0A6J7WDP6_9CAUD|nr:hypothetical protein UFOVP180_48 [uncultured Caudovirales phage]
MMNTMDIIASTEQVEQQTGINADELGCELEYFANSLIKLAQRIKSSEGLVNLSTIDRFSTSLTCGDMSDELSALSQQLRRMLDPYSDRLLNQFLAETGV